MNVNKEVLRGGRGGHALALSFNHESFYLLVFHCFTASSHQSGHCAFVRDEAADNNLPKKAGKDR